LVIGNSGARGSDGFDELFECFNNSQMLAALGFESSHWSESGFESAAIALDAVVGVLLGVVKRLRDGLFDRGLQGLCEISDDLVSFAMCSQRCGKEGFETDSSTPSAFSIPMR